MQSDGAARFMESQDRPSFGFVQKRLPWLIGLGAFIVYLATLNRWVRLESLGVIASAAGWDPLVPTGSPLFYLLTLPIRVIPGGLQPLLLNLLTALMAAASLGLLARSASLLPFDRTRDERIRERNENSFLSVPLSWLPPLLAAVALGFQSTFWNHATASTGEMLDVLVLAYLIRCLLEYRIAQEDRWLSKFALVYGLGITNSHALIAGLPCFFVAVVWIAGRQLFRADLLLKMVLLGIAGLLSYLLLPAIYTLSGQTSIGFMTLLKSMLSAQKSALVIFPKYLLITLSLTSILPLLLRSIRWPSVTGDTNAASAALTVFVMRFASLLLLGASLSIFFDVKWSPKAIGYGLPLFTFYYVGALSAAYLTGYFLLIVREPQSKTRRRPSSTSRMVAVLADGMGVLLLVAVLAWLPYQNFTEVWGNNGRSMREYALALVAPIEVSRPAILISDDYSESMLAEGALRKRYGSHPHIVVQTKRLEYRLYHRRLAQLHPNGWPLLENLDQKAEPIDAEALSLFVANRAKAGPVYYLQPSMGYYFEMLYARPYGLAQQLLPLSRELPLPPALSEQEIDLNQAFWKKLQPSLLERAKLNQTNMVEQMYAGILYSRAANQWGVQLQRSGRVQEAQAWFEIATGLNHRNQVASGNLSFNKILQSSNLASVTLDQPIETQVGNKTWDGLLLPNGPTDDPRWLYRLSQTLAGNGLYRQALIAAKRASEVLPHLTPLRIWRESMWAMTYLTQGDTKPAMDTIDRLRKEYPNDETVLETATQVALLSNDTQGALASILRQLQINPDNQRALLNQAALHIHAKAYGKALEPLNRLLAAQPDNTAALMNRAIANLQSNFLDAAEKDYLALKPLMPKYHAVYYGLGQIALRRGDKAGALVHFSDYLKHGQAGTQEYQEVEKQVKELKTAAPSR